MTDIVNQIYAGTITVADIASTGSATLATTNANTQYVIKDVNVSGVLVTGDRPGLAINDFRVAEIFAPATGSEIVDINSSIKYQAYETAPTLTDRNIKLISGLDTLFYENVTNKEINGTIVSTSGTTPVAISTVPTGKNANLEFAMSTSGATSGSLFYVRWDGNSSSTLYKRTGGVNGTETTVFSGSYTWFVFDGVDTYYYGQYENSNLYKYNINTGSTTAAYMGFVLSSTSYPSATLINNGKILVNPSGDGQTTYLYIIDPVANTYTQVTGLTNQGVNGTNYRIMGYYNAATNRYTLYKRYGTNLFKAQLNGALTVGSAYSGGVTNSTYNVGNIGPSSANYNCAYFEVDDTNYAIAQHGVSGKTDLKIYNTSTQSTTTQAWLPYATYADTIINYTQSAASPSTFTNTVKVRVTGVKTTL